MNREATVTSCIGKVIGRTNGEKPVNIALRAIQVKSAGKLSFLENQGSRTYILWKALRLQAFQARSIVHAQTIENL